MPWGKPTFLWAHPLFGLTATTEAAGNAVSNLIDRKEGTSWKATSTADQYIYFKPLINGGFETGDFTSWTQNSATIENTIVNSGSYSAKLVASGSNINGAESAPIIINPGIVYTVKAYNKVSILTTGSYYLQARFFADAAATDLLYSSSIVIHSSVVDWTLTSKTIGEIGSGADIEYPLGTASMKLVQTWWNSSDNPSGTAYMDDVSVSYDIDYLFIYNSNLYKKNATVVLQYSDDDVTYSDAFAAISPTAKTFAVYFTSVNKPFSRLKIVAQNLAEYAEISCGYWGKKTELDYATTSFDPRGRKTKANVKVTQGGIVSGIHKKYRERLPIRLRWDESDIDGTLYQQLDEFDKGCGMGHFGFHWEPTEHPTEIYHVRSDGRFSAPLAKSGHYSNLSVNLLGRFEE